MTVGPIFAGTIATTPLGVPGPVYAGQIQTIALGIPGPVFSGNVDQQPDPPTFSGVTGGVFPIPEPIRGFSGSSGDQAFLVIPMQHFGGATGGGAQIGPLRGYGAVTEGEVVFAGVPPATKLVAIGVAPSKVALTWNDVSDKETGFRIERSSNGQGMWATIGAVGEDVTIFIDQNATPLVVFDYRVIAFNSVEDAQPSNVASAFSPAPGQPPPPPSAPIPPRILEFLSPGVYGVERDVDGNIGGSKL